MPDADTNARLLPSLMALPTKTSRTRVRGGGLAAAAIAVLVLLAAGCGNNQRPSADQPPADIVEAETRLPPADIVEAEDTDLRAASEEFAYEVEGRVLDTSREGLAGRDAICLSRSIVSAVPDERADEVLAQLIDTGTGFSLSVLAPEETDSFIAEASNCLDWAAVVAEIIFFEEPLSDLPLCVQDAGGDYRFEQQAARWLLSNDDYGFVSLRDLYGDDCMLAFVAAELADVGLSAESAACFAPWVVKGGIDAAQAESGAISDESEAAYGPLTRSHPAVSACLTAAEVDLLGPTGVLQYEPPREEEPSSDDAPMTYEPPREEEPSSDDAPMTYEPPREEEPSSDDAPMTDEPPREEEPSSDDALAAPAASTYKAVAAGHDVSCAIAIDDTVVCWGNDSLDDAPAGTYKAVAASAITVCAIAVDDTLTCSGWGVGWSDDGQAEDLADTYKAVAAGSTHVCAIAVDGNPRMPGQVQPRSDRCTRRRLQSRHRRLGSLVRCSRRRHPRMLGLERPWTGRRACGRLHGCRRRRVPLVRYSRRRHPRMLGRGQRRADRRACGRLHGCRRRRVPLVRCSRRRHPRMLGLEQRRADRRACGRLHGCRRRRGPLVRCSRRRHPRMLGLEQRRADRRACGHLMTC